ncbi:sugar phosphate isomerase/epimerase family protein [Pseudomonas parasichuanensis]|uniref:sugar phosphate isomerase/epimerase family protein n=1 Tax=Pseudomonas parasichuanensis TaxID=2892329 RepID=UPI001F33ACE0|nr:sugar phosphate isomerase/epimerase family protein [Pseudomonas parasichuanensis]
MRLSISNIAWEVAEDEQIAELLAASGVDAIDIAPGKYFPQPAQASEQQILQVRDWWRARGVEIVGMQALLFGTSGLNVFGDADSRAALLEHLAAVCRIAGKLGATRVVFGSPKNRDRSGLDDQQAQAIAVAFFRQVGAIAQAEGVVFCLEPNPTCYGANFMTCAADTAHIVRQVAHPAVRMQFDTGALAINGEDPLAVLADCAELIGHVHASEPQLLPLGDGATPHADMAVAIARYLPEHIVTVEMVATAGEAHGQSVARALGIARQHYLEVRP